MEDESEEGRDPEGGVRRCWKYDLEDGTVVHTLAQQAALRTGTLDAIVTTWLSNETQVPCEAYQLVKSRCSRVARPSPGSARDRGRRGEGGGNKTAR
jgi:hypothetical protein